ncbi:MAG: ribosome small subunit-dependent GTPase A [Balneolaceae bacterium]|nr:MAG: ribosome small subunit-dependent GTPase A [Balneolaceae bacterium]
MQSEQIKGRVVLSTGSWYSVIAENGSMIKCRLAGKMRLSELKQTNPVAVGDIVYYAENSDGTGTISDVEDRTNKITRLATHGRRGEQILVSNVDYGIVVQSFKQPAYKTGFIDRFIVTCEAYEVEPVVLMNKMDLCGSDAETDKLRELYEGLGYKFYTSAIDDEASIIRLRDLMKNRTSVFIGPSGVGKTSLLNMIEPGIEKPIGSISTFSNKGKHTTTFAELIPLSFGGYLVDTPGIREFGLVNIEPAELSLYYPEMLEPRERCRYYNCTHVHEPGCAVIEAVENGLIAPSRYASYRQIVTTLDT